MYARVVIGEVVDMSHYMLEFRDTGSSVFTTYSLQPTEWPVCDALACIVSFNTSLRLTDIRGR